jgi:hypothetical protein
LHGPSLIRLALDTLGSFNFGQHNLLLFVRDHVVLFLDDNEVSVRKAAVLAAARILNRHASEKSSGATQRLVDDGQLVVVQWLRRWVYLFLGPGGGGGLLCILRTRHVRSATVLHRIA